MELSRMFLAIELLAELLVSALPSGIRTPDASTSRPTLATTSPPSPSLLPAIWSSSSSSSSSPLVDLSAIMNGAELVMSAREVNRKSRLQRKLRSRRHILATLESGETAESDSQIDVRPTISPLETNQASKVAENSSELQGFKSGKKLRRRQKNRKGGKRKARRSKKDRRRQRKLRNRRARRQNGGVRNLRRQNRRCREGQADCARGKLRKLVADKEDYLSAFVDSRAREHLSKNAERKRDNSVDRKGDATDKIPKRVNKDSKKENSSRDRDASSMVEDSPRPEYESETVVVVVEEEGDDAVRPTKVTVEVDTEEPERVEPEQAEEDSNPRHSAGERMKIILDNFYPSIPVKAAVFPNPATPQPSPAHISSALLMEKFLSSQPLRNRTLRNSEPFFDEDVVLASSLGEGQRQDRSTEGDELTTDGDAEYSNLSVEERRGEYEVASSRVGSLHSALMKNYLRSRPVSSYRRSRRSAGIPDGLSDPQQFSDDTVAAAAAQSPPSRRRRSAVSMGPEELLRGFGARSLTRRAVTQSDSVISVVLRKFGHRQSL